MEPTEITGTYTYRNFLNEPNIVDDFGKLRFAKAELTLVAGQARHLSAMLASSRQHRSGFAVHLRGLHGGDEEG